MKNIWTKMLSGMAALVVTAGLAWGYTLTTDLIIGANASAPAVSACGSGALGTGSSDMAGDVTATGATGCTLTFGRAYATAPSCVFTNLTVPSRAYTVAVTAASITLASLTAADKVAYVCIAKAGG